jgi:hypothetical protein
VEYLLMLDAKIARFTVRLHGHGKVRAVFHSGEDRTLLFGIFIGYGGEQSSCQINLFSVKYLRLVGQAEGGLGLDPGTL